MQLYCLLYTMQYTLQYADNANYGNTTCGITYRRIVPIIENIYPNNIHVNI